MKRLECALPLAAALLFASCSDGGSAGPPGPPDEDGAWIDGATVVVARDETTGRETVTLVDPASGFSLVVDDEPLVAGVNALDHRAGAIAVAQLTR